MKHVKVWNGLDPINGIPANRVLENREDLANALGDIFLVMNGDQVLQIEIGSVIRAIYDFSEELDIQGIADAYLIRKQEDDARQEQEVLTIEELQEEVALLSYDNMIMQSQMNGGVAVANMNLDEEYVESPKHSLIKRWYAKGFWTAEMVQIAVNCGQLTQAEYDIIVNN